MNNIINDIKNTLEGTNNRIMEEEDRITELEDRTVEMTEADPKKRMNKNKEMRIVYYHSHYRGRVPEENTK